VYGFTVAFQTSMSIGEKRSLGRSGEACGNVSKDLRCRRGSRGAQAGVEGLVKRGQNALIIDHVQAESGSRRMIEIHCWKKIMAWKWKTR
jgi:hypothetical protein